MTARRSASHLLVPLLPTVDAHASSKKYVDDQVASAIVGDIDLGSIDGLTEALDSKVDKSILDAKGDLIVATGANTPGLLAAGADGYALIADNTQTTGLKWASIAIDESALVHKTGAETLTDKTLTSPVINAPTGITKTDVGLTNVDNTSDVSKNAAVATLTSKTIDGANNTFANIPFASVMSSVGSSPTFGSMGSYLTYASSTAANVPVPSGVAINDVILVVLYVDTGGTAVTPPAGFTEAASSPVSQSGSDTRVFWKRATGADAGTYNFTLGVAGPRSGYAVRYSGCVTTGTPIDVANSSGNTGTTALPTVSATTTINNDLVVWISNTFQGNAVTPPTGFTKNAEGVTDDSTRGFCFASKVQSPAGATGTLSASITAGTSSKRVWMGALIPATSPQSLADLVATLAPLASPAFTGTPTGITKAHVGLGSVDNTADTAKPVSTAQQTALDLKANLASPTFTGTVAGITKTMVGLSNVDNTSNATERAAVRTLTNVRITKRVNDVSAPGATPTLAWDSYDFIVLRGIAAAITSMSSGITGTPTHGQPWLVRFKDNGTARAITWGASYRAIGITLPITTTVNKTMYVGGFYNSTDSIYDVTAVGIEA